MQQTETRALDYGDYLLEYQTVLFDIGQSIGELSKIYSSKFKTVIPPELLQNSHLIELSNKIIHNQYIPPNKLLELQTILCLSLTSAITEYFSSLTYTQNNSETTAESDFKLFSHKDWNQHSYFRLIKKIYKILHKHALACVESTEGLDTKTKEQIKFHLKTLLTYISPTNTVWSNPEVIETISKNGGINLLLGIKNYLNDLVLNNGQLNIRMADMKAFKIGENLAASPGKVIFENDIIQLIQYSPKTSEVYKTPILIIPPCINKYYILDLSTKNSFVKWLVDQGYTVYMISWVNPGPELAHKKFEDYMIEGPVAALNAITHNTNVPEVHMVGYCIGGTLLSCTLAYMKAKMDTRAKSATFLMSLIDFSDPGEVGVFIDEKQIDNLEKIMMSAGYLNGHLIDMTFNLLRPNDVIWPYFINNYLLGKPSKAFDIFYWNADSTNQPYAMYNFYLRNMYLHNLLREPGGITLAGVPITLSEVTTPTIFVAAEADHITTWKAVYSGLKLLGGPTEFVLTESGHVRGMVNPPTDNKYGFKINKNYTNKSNFQEPAQEWLNDATKIEGSWWSYWLVWLNNHDSSKVPARQINESKVIHDAPGTYVLKRI